MLHHPDLVVKVYAPGRAGLAEEAEVHGRNVMVHAGRGLIVDISDFLNPEPCTAWRDLRLAYFLLYRPLIAPLRLRAPASLLNGYRL